MKPEKHHVWRSRGKGQRDSQSADPEGMRGMKIKATEEPTRGRVSMPFSGVCHFIPRAGGGGGAIVEIQLG